MTKLPPASVIGTEVRQMKSKATGKDYRISIALPYGYFNQPGEFDFFEHSRTAWPVVYIVDANWYFGMVTQIVRTSSWCGRASDAIIVGVGYPEDPSPPQSHWNVNVWREHDLNPTLGEEYDRQISQWLKQEVKSGGADQLLKFFKLELIPWVDRQYRTDPSHRILAGHSSGGLFTLYAMFQEPGLFRSYVANSPWLMSAENPILGLESAFAKRHKRLAAQVYIGVGELEESADTTTLTDVYRFAAQLESRKYKGLSFTKQVFADNNHCEVVAPSFQAGLRLALSK